MRPYETWVLLRPPHLLLPCPFPLFPVSHVTLLSSYALWAHLCFRSSAFAVSSMWIFSPRYSHGPFPDSVPRLQKHHLHREAFLQHSIENTSLPPFILLYFLQQYFLFCIIFMLHNILYHAFAHFLSHPLKIWAPWGEELWLDWFPTHSTKSLTYLHKLGVQWTSEVINNYHNL